MVERTKGLDNGEMPEDGCVAAAGDGLTSRQGSAEVRSARPFSFIGGAIAFKYARGRLTGGSRGRIQMPGPHAKANVRNNINDGNL
jgi:hypothetical protein